MVRYAMLLVITAPMYGGYNSTTWRSAKRTRIRIKWLPHRDTDITVGTPTVWGGSWLGWPELCEIYVFFSSYCVPFCHACPNAFFFPTVFQSQREPTAPYTAFSTCCLQTATSLDIVISFAKRTWTSGPLGSDNIAVIWYSFASRPVCNREVL